jgi:hypothetical protein
MKQKSVEDILGIEIVNYFIIKSNLFQLLLEETKNCINESYNIEEIEKVLNSELKEARNEGHKSKEQELKKELKKQKARKQEYVNSRLDNINKELAKVFKEFILYERKIIKKY